MMLLMKIIIYLKLKEPVSFVPENLFFCRFFSLFSSNCQARQSLIISNQFFISRSLQCNVAVAVKMKFFLVKNGCMNDLALPVKELH